MSLTLQNFKKKFHLKKDAKQQIFILGSVASGKSALLHILAQKFNMKDKGHQNMAGVELDSISNKLVQVHSYKADKETFFTMTKFVQQSTTKSVIFVIDSRKKHMLDNCGGNDVRSCMKEIAKVLLPNTYVLILCNKQDITNEEILKPEEIGRQLDIKRVFEKHKAFILGCSFIAKTNIDKLTEFLSSNSILSLIDDEKNDDGDHHGKIREISNKHKNSKSFANLFKRKKQNELIMILGLQKCGKSRLLDSFGFGKKSKTSIALFEAETLKYNKCEFHAWNYENRAWPMAKGFFTKCTLLIYVIDSTQFDKLHSDNIKEWTVESYLKKILGITHDQNTKNAAAHAPQTIDVFNKSKSFDPNNVEKKKKKKEEWPLKCPILILLNKSDLDQSQITAKDLEDEIGVSRLMKSKGIKHQIQETSAKTKDGIYDALIWCYMNGLLRSINNIEEYAVKNNIKLPMNLPEKPNQMKKHQTK